MKGWLRMVLLGACMVLVGWGHALVREARQFHQLPPKEMAWRPSHAIWHRIMAGPVPGLVADLAVLEVFNLYHEGKTTGGVARARWWRALSYQLHRALALDPRFHDAYRLTEGLLAYEPGFTDDAVAMIERHAHWLDSGEYLLVASFLAWHELHDNARAIRLARLAAGKPDTASLAAGFAAKLIRQEQGCRAAMAFLRMRARSMPKVYRAGMDAALERLRRDPACLRPRTPPRAVPDARAGMLG